MIESEYSQANIEKEKSPNVWKSSYQIDMNVVDGMVWHADIYINIQSVLVGSRGFIYLS